MKFKIKHLKNLLVRVFTGDKYYVCEECHKIHKRDGNEVRLDEDKEHLRFYPLWYGSVGWECFVAQQEELRRVFRESIFGIKDI
jgi:hypothetical protein